MDLLCRRVPSLPLRLQAGGARKLGGGCRGGEEGGRGGEEGGRGGAGGGSRRFRGSGFGSKLSKRARASLSLIDFMFRIKFHATGGNVQLVNCFNGYISVLKCE